MSVQVALVKTAQTCNLDWDYLKPCLWNRRGIIFMYKQRP